MADKLSKNVDETIVATEAIPTKELLRDQRKKNYDAYKNARKQEKLDKIKRKDQERGQKRLEKDKTLMGMLVKATDLDEKSR